MASKWYFFLMNEYQDIVTLFKETSLSTEDCNDHHQKILVFTEF